LAILNDPLERATILEGRIGRKLVENKISWPDVSRIVYNRKRFRFEEI
jgi:hypothetical protein